MKTNMEIYFSFLIAILTPIFLSLWTNLLAILSSGNQPRKETDVRITLEHKGDKGSVNHHHYLLQREVEHERSIKGNDR